MLKIKIGKGALNSYEKRRNSVTPYTVKSVS